MTPTTAPYYGLDSSLFVRQLSHETQVRVWQRLLDAVDADTARVAMNSRVADLVDTISLDGVSLD